MKTGCLAFVVYAAVICGVWGATGYVAYHFISKFW